jgi:hypothetical protein
LVGQVHPNGPWKCHTRAGSSAGERCSGVSWFPDNALKLVAASTNTSISVRSALSVYSSSWQQSIDDPPEFVWDRFGLHALDEAMIDPKTGFEM